MTNPLLRALLQSTPLRLATAIVIMFTLASGASIGAGYLLSRAAAERALVAKLQEVLALLTADTSPAKIVDLVAVQAAVIDPDFRFVSFRTDSGQVVGNTELTWTANGYSILHAGPGDSDGDNDEAGTYLALGAEFQGGYLLIAQSRKPVNDVDRTFRDILLLSLLPALSVAMAGSYILARRAVVRVENISSTLNRLTRGDLSARVPELAGADDDLSVIGRKIDIMAAAQEAGISALRQISADIAHDLKTPIQRVSLLLNQLQERGTLTPADAEQVKRAQDTTEGIVETFQSLLLIAQIEGGSAKSRLIPVDLTALCEKFVDIYTPSAEESGRTIRLQKPDRAVVPVKGDAGLLGQALANLIENALNHTPKGSQIEVSLEQSASCVVLSVADNGPGVPEAERENVLLRLYRLEHSRCTPGHGLGLSLVAAIAALHDAKLTLGDNNPGLKISLNFPCPEGERPL